MMILLFAVLLGSIFALQTTGTIENMAEENVQMAVDLECAATSFSLFTPLILVIAVALFLGALISMSQSFGASYDTE